MTQHGGPGSSDVRTAGDKQTAGRQLDGTCIRTAGLPKDTPKGKSAVEEDETDEEPKNTCVLEDQYFRVQLPTGGKRTVRFASGGVEPCYPSVAGNVVRVPRHPTAIKGQNIHLQGGGRYYFAMFIPQLSSVVPVFPPLTGPSERRLAVRPPDDGVLSITDTCIDLEIVGVDVEAAFLGVRDDGELRSDDGFDDLRVPEVLHAIKELRVLVNCHVLRSDT